MKVIGLTGGISSGKSTISGALEEKGAIIIDADKIAHDNLEINKPAWQEIVAYFGEKILNSDNSIDRKKLGDIIFSDPQKRAKLDKIMHSRVIADIKKILEDIKVEQPEALVLVEVPLLFELNLVDLFDETWVVWVDRETQITRLMERNNLSREEAVMRINSQMNLDEKARRADKVIDNRAAVEDTINAANKVFNNIFVHN
jgi:dephospho-CoA kinase